MKKSIKQTEKHVPVEHVIPLNPPVRMYTAKELPAMPLKQMIDCRDAQEEYFIKSILTLKPQAKELKKKMESGLALIAITKKKRIRYHTEFFINGESVSRRIINQLAHRGMINIAGIIL